VIARVWGTVLYCAYGLTLLVMIAWFDLTYRLKHRGRSPF
jgi:hypothetical protein